MTISRVGLMNEVEFIFWAIVVLVSLDFVRFGWGSGVYDSTKSNEHDRMSGGGW